MRLLRESWKRELLSEEGKTTEDFKKDLDVKWKIGLFFSNTLILKPITIPKVSSELNSGIIESNNQSPKFSEIIPEYLNFMRKTREGYLQLMKQKFHIKITLRLLETNQYLTIQGMMLETTET